jgi:alginate O-acetyltransferase complex protein AlgI
MDKTLPSLKELLQMLTNFGLVTLAWIFFRAENIGHAVHYIGSLASGLLHKDSYITFLNLLVWKWDISNYLCYLVIFILVEWAGRNSKHPLENIKRSKLSRIRYFIYFILVFSVIYLGGKEQQFIYFQF